MPRLPGTENPTSTPKTGVEVGFSVPTADAPDISGAFGAGAVDYGYESRSLEAPQKARGLQRATPLPEGRQSACRPMAPNGAGTVGS